MGDGFNRDPRQYSTGGNIAACGVMGATDYDLVEKFVKTELLPLLSQPWLAFRIWILCFFHHVDFTTQGLSYYYGTHIAFPEVLYAAHLYCRVCGLCSCAGSGISPGESLRSVDHLAGFCCAKW
jgi:hypothetical protein